MILLFYLPLSISNRKSNTAFDRLLTFCEKYNNVLITGNLNAGSKNLCDCLGNGKEISFEVSVLNSSFHFLIGMPAFLNPPSMLNQSGSVLDMALANSASQFWQWNPIMDKISNGHHTPICVSSQAVFLLNLRLIQIG